MSTPRSATLRPLGARGELGLAGTTLTTMGTGTRCDRHRALGDRPATGVAGKAIAAVADLRRPR